MLPIDKDIPLPTNKLRRGAPAKYPYRQLGIGESFFVAFEGGSRKRHDTNLRNYTTQRGRVLGATFSVRSEPDGWRVWRTA